MADFSKRKGVVVSDSYNYNLLNLNNKTLRLSIEDKVKYRDIVLYKTSNFLKK